MSELYELFSQHPRISTDTRRIEPDSIFFALRGDTFDGNRFVAEALEKGAAYAVSDDPQVAASDGDPACDLLRRSELPGRLLPQLYDLLSPAAQQHPGLRQNDVVLAAAEQLDSQFLLQLHQLAGQGGLRQMEQDGHIVRETDPKDRRKTLVRITPAGERARKANEQAMNDYFARIMARLTPDQLAQANAVKDALLAAIEAENAAMKTDLKGEPPHDENF